MDVTYQTIEKLPEEVEDIFMKIKEQLEDRSHPLSRIVDEFQVQFKRYVDSEIEMFSSEFDLDLNFDFKRESQKINSSSYGIDKFEQDEMRQ